MRAPTLSFRRAIAGYKDRWIRNSCRHTADRWHFELILGVLNRLEKHEDTENVWSTIKSNTPPELPDHLPLHELLLITFLQKSRKAYGRESKTAARTQFMVQWREETIRSFGVPLDHEVAFFTNIAFDLPVQEQICGEAVRSAARAAAAKAEHHRI